MILARPRNGTAAEVLRRYFPAPRDEHVREIPVDPHWELFNQAYVVQAEDEHDEARNEAVRAVVDGLGERDQFLVHSLFFCGRSLRQTAGDVGLQKTQVARLRDRLIERLQLQLAAVVA